MKINSVLAVILSSLLVFSFSISCKKDPSKVIPTISTSVVTNITATSVTCGGEISSDGNSPITSRGLCWSLNQNPTILNSKTEDGVGTGAFASTITGLSPGVTYYIRAYATNTIGTAYGEQISFNTSAVIPVLNTLDIKDIEATNALSGGNITNNGGAQVLSMGICWSTKDAPTIADNKTVLNPLTSLFTSSITGLEPNSTYFLRAYATNSQGTGYGNTISFKTLGIETLFYGMESFPGVKGEIGTTLLNGAVVTCIVKNGLNIFQGDIILPPPTKGAALETQLWPGGVVYYKIDDNFPEKSRVTDAFKLFEKTNITFKPRSNEPNYLLFYNLKGAGCLSHLGMVGGEQTIYVDTWGTPGIIAHEIGHAIGLLHEHTKAGRDEYITINVNNIKEYYENAFTIFPNSINTPGFDFNSLMLYSSFAFSKRVMGTDGSYSFLPTMVKKDGSTFFPQQVEFTESDISMINQLYPSSPVADFIASKTTITVGETIHFSDRSSNDPTGWSWSFGDGNSGESANPFHKYLSAGTFSVSLTATNRSGSNTKTKLNYITVNPATSSATLTTADATNVKATTAQLGGNVTREGGSAVFEKGVVYSLTQQPTTANNKLSDSNGGIGSFVINADGLISNTKYYVRAYAVNSEGTSYGSEVSFTTLPEFSEPVVTTSLPERVTPTTATLGGNIASSGGYPVTDKGIVYSNVQYPTTNNTKVSAGSGAGQFSLNLFGLTAERLYYARAYATTNVGTVYGNQISFYTSLAPIAQFFASQSNAFIGNSVQFTDQSENSPTAWLWDFGDGTTSTSRNPSHIYSSAGRYTVTLTVTNSFGSDNETKVSYITVINTFTDARDGNIYKTVKIGNQVWMAENLKYLPYVSFKGTFDPNIPLIYVYGYNERDADEAKATEMYKKYGVLYNSLAAVNGEGYSSSIPSGVRGVCPQGWHLPSYGEWQALINSVGTWEDAGGKLKEEGTVNWLSPNTGATNSSGFTALPGGYYSYRYYRNEGEYTGWHSSSLYNHSLLYYISVKYDLRSIIENQTTDQSVGFYIRCVKD